MIVLCCTHIVVIATHVLYHSAGNNNNIMYAVPSTLLVCLFHLLAFSKKNSVPT